MKVKEILKKIANKVKALFGMLDRFTENYVKVAVLFCEELKKAVDNGNFEMFCNVADVFIPGDQSGFTKSAQVYLKKNLPRFISSLQIVGVISDKQNWEGQMKSVYDLLTKASDDSKTQLWRGLSEKLLEYYSDGQFTTQEKRELLDYYYHNYVKQ